MRKLIVPDFVSYPGPRPPRGYRTLDEEAVCFLHDIYYDRKDHCFRSVPDVCAVVDAQSDLILRHVDNFHDATPFGFKKMVIQASEVLPDDLIFDASPARKYWLYARDAIVNFDHFIKIHRIKTPQDNDYKLAIIRAGFDFPQPEITEPEQPVIIPASYGGW